MPSYKPLRVAALVDLPLSPLSGGHARGWEKLALAAQKSDLPLDLTIYFSGKELAEELGPFVRLRHLSPVFSTAKLKFLPYVPDNTDLAPYHPKLAKELASYDVIHTTDGFFSFARTAERISRKRGIPLVTSFHTDTPAYTRVFTRRTIETIFGKNKFSYFLTDILRLPEKQEAKMNRRLRDHLAACDHAIATRQEDLALATKICGAENVSFMRTPIDRDIFGPHRKDRAGIEKEYAIPQGRVICLFVGRLDEGKNIYTLLDALEKLIGDGIPVHLITAGVGPAAQDLKERLGDHVTLAGALSPQKLGRLYASVDMLTMPSEVEMRSLVAVEALTSGLPVLLSEKSGVAAHYNNTPALRVVKGGEDNWSRAILDLATDTALCDRMGQEGITYTNNNIPAWKDFLAQDFLAVWQKVYKEKYVS